MNRDKIRRLTVGATALLAVGSLLTATAPTAAAHYNYYYQGKDFISVSETHGPWQRLRPGSGWQRRLRDLAPGSGPRSRGRVGRRRQWL